MQQVADRVLVMYAGQVVEEGAVAEVTARPHHPYTRALLKAVPEIGAGHERLLAIPGSAPQPGAWPSGCRFHPRCPQRQEDCDVRVPELIQTTAGRRARCMYWEMTPR